jgi:hypothetical protein
MDPAVKFLSRGPGYTLFLTPTEAALALIKSSADTNPPKGTLLRMKLVGANPQPPVSGVQELRGKVNYFIGDDPRQWRTNVPTYAKVKYESVYPGVDLVYYGDGRQLEYDFVVAPGSDPKAIALAFEGADNLEVDAQGDLVLAVNGGELRLRKPLVYQEVDGRRKPIAGNYILKPRSRVGFQVAAYDTSKALVIDPVLVYSTYLGGSGVDRASGIAVDGSGNAYMTGDTISINFPTKAPTGFTPYQSTLSKSTTTDCFVTKINTTVSGAASLVYSTYLGGSSNDECSGIAIDSSGNAYVTGQTSSTNFPGSALSKAKGSGDIFVVKLDSTGSAISPPLGGYSAFLGGSSADAGFAIAVDAFGQAYVTGKTTSKDFPVVGGFQSTPGVAGGDPSGDAFVTKLNAAGTAILYSTYLGGSGAEEGRGIAVGSAGHAYVTGTTSSTSGFPLMGALDSLLGGTSDAFVTKVNTNVTGGASLVYSTYLGGGCAEQGRAIAVDASGSAYVTGQTFSTDLPGAAAYGFQTALGEAGMTCGASGDAFVAKLNAVGSALSYSTYLGGSAADLGLGIAVDGSGNAYVTGQTFSTDFPAPGGFDTVLGAPSDAFVTRINTNVPGPTSLVYSTLLGGTGDESASGIALDSSGYVYVSGQTSSADFLTAPGGDTPTVLGFQTCLGSGLGGPCQTSGTDAFVAKLSNNAPPVLTSPGNKIIAEGSTLSFTLSASDPDAGQTLTFSISGGVQNGMSLISSTGAFSWTPSEAQGPGVYSVTFRVIDNGAPPLFNEKTVTITVTEVNSAPTLSGVPVAATIPELVPYSFTATATDPDIPAQTLTFSLVGAPAGASIGAASGIFTWTPTEAQGPGTYPFTVRVSDGVTNTNASITITVTEVNTPPVLTVPGPQTVNEGVPLTFTVSVTDADLPANTWTFSAINLPPGASFDPLAQTFAWTPNSAQGGPNPYFVQFQVSDGQFIDVKGVSITVNDNILDSDGDGIPDSIDNCPFVPNANQNPDVCQPNSPQGTGNLSLASGINVTLDVTFTNPDPVKDLFVQSGQSGQLSLTHVICRVINNATGQEIPPAGIPEFAPISFFRDGFTIAPNSSESRSITFSLAEAGYTNLPPSGSLTVACSYVNFAQPPEPQPDDVKILTGTVTPPPQTAFLGTYDFTLMEPLASQKVVNQVPVKFTLMSAGAVVSTCTCKLFLQRLADDGIILIGNPMPATSTGGEVGNVAQYDPINSQYIFHLSTRSLANSPWQVQIRPDDFSVHNVTISVQH